MNTNRLFTALLCITYNAAPTNLPKLAIERVFIDTKSNKIHVLCKIINGSKPNRFYKPNNSTDFCYRLNYVNFKSVKTSKQYNYLPCQALTDLNKIEITEKNSVNLDSNQSYRFEFVLSQRGFNDKIRPGSLYHVKVTISHNHICGGDTCSVFTGILSSERIAKL